MAHITEKLIKTGETEAEIRKRLGVVGRDDIQITHVGHHYDGDDVFYVFSEEELFAFATEEFLLNFFDAYMSSSADSDRTRYHHAHQEGVYFSWRRPKVNSRYLCILFSEGLEGVDDISTALSQRWPEPSGGLIVDTKWNDIHFVRFNAIAFRLPEVVLTLEGAYDPRDGHLAYRRHLPIVKKFIEENPLPSPETSCDLMRFF